MLIFISILGVLSILFKKVRSEGSKQIKQSSPTDMRPNFDHGLLLAYDFIHNSMTVWLYTTAI